MASERGVDDNHNYLRSVPSKLSKQQQQLAQEVVKKGINALKLENTPAHAEFVYTKKGPKLIEIGPRAGGYRTRMYNIAFGINVCEAIIQSAQGNLPTIEQTKEHNIAVFEIFPSRTGVLESVQNIPKLEKLPSFYYHSQKRAIGETVGLAKDGYRAISVIILTHADKETFSKDVDYVTNNVIAKIKDN